MKRVPGVAAFVLSVLGTGTAIAADDCQAPMSEWQPLQALLQKLNDDGWDVKRIKTDDGCYEADAIDEKGRHVEVYFDPKTFEVVELKVDE
jgi:hypothetical protein